MKRCTRLAALLAVAATAVGPAAAQDSGAGNARVQLVSGPRPPQLGESVLLGVRFEIRPGWHIYWKNPGGAGLATDVQWRLPAGVEAGELQWPVPVAFTQSGDIPGYGYEGGVVLAAELRSSRAVPDGAVVGATVSWLACNDVCVLGSAELEAPWAEVAVDPGFSDWSESLPRALDASRAPFTLTTQGGVAAGTIGLWLQWQTAPQPVEFFPNPPEGLAVEDVTIQTRGGLTRIDADLRPMAGLESQPDTLDSVVVLTDENKRRRGWKIAVDLTENRE
jgi:DsbC/DsbD-like thiol-disulfide interchange protein